MGFSGETVVPLGVGQKLDANSPRARLHHEAIDRAEGDGIALTGPGIAQLEPPTRRTALHRVALSSTLLRRCHRRPDAAAPGAHTGRIPVTRATDEGSCGGRR